MENEQNLTVKETPFVPTPEQQARIQTLTQGVNIKDTQQVLAFGSEAQEKIAKFSDEVLQRVRTSETGEISDTLTGLVAQLKGFDTEEEKGFFNKLFKSAKNQVDTMRARFEKVEVNVEGIAGTLRTHQQQLVSDITMFDKLYELNQEAFSELNLYIEAGDQEIKRLREQELAPLTKKAQETQDQVDAQAASDMAAQIERFEKKVHDLRLTRTVSIQSAPQIRLLQNADSILAEKIESTIVNTLPLWKSQMTIALGAAHTEGALKAQQAVTDATNELLKKNADALKMSTIKSAEASQRGIVDIETLRHTNQALIESLDEVRRIEIEGTQKRKDAEKELVQLEGQLREKLLSFQNDTAGTTAAPKSFEERVAAAKPVETAADPAPVTPADSWQAPVSTPTTPVEAAPVTEPTPTTVEETPASAPAPTAPQEPVQPDDLRIPEEPTSGDPQ